MDMIENRVGEKVQFMITFDLFILLVGYKKSTKMSATN